MKFFLYIALILSFTFGPLQAINENKTRVLFNSLNISSVSQHLAFYLLYPETSEGHKALNHAWTLLSPPDKKEHHFLQSIPDFTPATNAIINMVNKLSDEETPLLNDRELSAINELAQRLPNRQLKGCYATSEEEVLALPPGEIDLARGLFLSKMGNTPEAMQKIRSYESMIDLMALQILARIPLDSSPEVKINEMNYFIFDEMGFRFPPHSLYAKDIDIYTFLPSVLDSRRGVCLGVSILYICLAQRLNLNLEMITPPGHIYVRYRDPETDKIINIETTARGINMECEVYLSVATRSLEQRNVKEVIGLAHFNEAAVYWQKDDNAGALDCYHMAKKYIPDDMLLKELMGYNYLIVGDKEKGLELLNQVKNHLHDYAVTKETLTEDILNNHADAEGIKAIFMHVNENRDSVLKKKAKLEESLLKFPHFRTGYFCLASTWLQLHRYGEALRVLEYYHTLHPNDPTAEYYMSMIYSERLDYNKAWDHLRYAEAIVKTRDHNPKALKELRKELNYLCPE